MTNPTQKISFRNSLATENACQPPQGLFSPSTLFEIPVSKDYPLGTTGADVRDMMRAVEENKRAEIAIPKEFGTSKAVVESYWGKNLEDFVLLLRTANVPLWNNTTVSTSWLLAVKDDGDRIITPDEEKSAVLIAGGLAAGGIMPIANIRAADINGDGFTDISYSKFNRETSSYDDYTAIRTDEPQSRDAILDRDLILSAMAYYDAAVQAVETAYVKAFIRKEFLAEVDMVEPSKAVVVPEVLRPLYSALKDIPAEGLPKELKTLRDILIRRADQSLLLAADELEYRVKELSQLTKDFKELEKTLKWREKNMTRPEYEQMMKDEPDTSIRVMMTRNYEKHFSPMFEEGGRYHAFIDRMNEIAENHGFGNYAEMRIAEQFGMDMPSFKKWVSDAMSATEADARAYIDELKKLSGKDSLGFWEAQGMDAAWIKKETGIGELPAIAAEDGFRIVREFFKDLGFDMSKPPYGNITMDPYFDDMKFNVPGTAATATPEHAYFISNARAGEKIPLGAFETFVHELTHDMHYLTSGAAGGGYSSYQNDMYSYVAEGLTMSTQDLPFGTPALFRRYFSGLKGFDDKLADVLPRIRKQSGAWEIRHLLMMAVSEIYLYESTEPWEKKINAWKTMVKDNLFVETEGMNYSQIMCRSHPYGEQSQMGYASYPLGFATVKRIREAIIKEGTPKELLRYGDAMRAIMKEGALADQTTLSGQIPK